jgi:hypothetical protein
MGSWDNHRNARPRSRMGQLMFDLNPENRVYRRFERETYEREDLEDMPTAKGGRTWSRSSRGEKLPPELEKLRKRAEKGDKGAAKKLAEEWKKRNK